MACSFIIFSDEKKNDNNNKKDCYLLQFCLTLNKLKNFSEPAQFYHVLICTHTHLFLAKECAQYWLTTWRTKPAQLTCGKVN